MPICQYDEAFTTDEMREETGLCEKCRIPGCPNHAEKPALDFCPRCGRYAELNYGVFFKYVCEDCFKECESKERNCGGEHESSN